MGVSDVRGMANYPCLERPGLGCDEGPCLAGMKCARFDGGCEYFDAVRSAKRARIVVTNYAYWLKSGERLGSFDCIIADEAHDVADLLSAHLAIVLGDGEVRGGLAIKWPERDVASEWRQWAKEALRRVDLIAGRTQSWAPVKEHTALKDLRTRFDRLAELPDDWLRVKDGNAWRFEPLWPAAFAEKALWRGVGKVILASATLTPKTLELLGVPERETDWVNMEHSFPVANRLVYIVPGVRVDHRMNDDDQWWWVKAIDRVADKWSGEGKGIIHTVSFKRAQYLKEKSGHRAHMILNESATTARVVAEFKRRAAPAILVSPSVSTGWDFPADMAQWQVIGKIPFPDSRNGLMAARSKADPEYPMHLTMMTLIQMCGRIVRGPSDCKPTFIVDEQAKWFIPKYRHLAAGWFMEQVRWAKETPAPVGDDE